MKIWEVKRRDGQRRRESGQIHYLSSCIVEALKASPQWKLIFFLMIIGCGMFTWFSYLTSNLSMFSRVERSFHAVTHIESSEMSYVHFPQPKTFNREECSYNPVRYFVILTNPRSGSSWFRTMLHSHMNISCTREHFLQDRLRKYFSTIVETLDQIYNLDLMFDYPDWKSVVSHKNECIGAVGFKWMLYQGVLTYGEEVAQYLESRGVMVIFLFRRNLLRQLVSLMALEYNRNASSLLKREARNDAQASSGFEVQLHTAYKPEVDTEKHISKFKSVEEDIRQSLEVCKNTRHVIIQYEDLLKNPTKILNEMQDFLKVPRHNLTSDYMKIHSGSLSSLIKNWAEVTDTLKGTKYEGFLYED